MLTFFISHVAQIVYIVGVQHGFPELPKFISNAPGLVEEKVTVPGNRNTRFLSELAAQTTPLTTLCFNGCCSSCLFPDLSPKCREHGVSLLRDHTLAPCPSSYTQPSPNPFTSEGLRFLPNKTGILNTSSAQNLSLGAYLSAPDLHVGIPGLRFSLQACFIWPIYI